MSDLLVYEEWDREIVPSSHYPNVYYRVFFGTVDWERNNDLRRAYTILMQRGNTADWNVAKSRGEIYFQMPAHILPDDLDRVLAALATLRGRNER
jgi:hypothetical protein